MGIKRNQIEALYSLLQQMDALARRLEDIAPDELAATRDFDGERLVAMMDIRALCHQELASLEVQCRTLLANSGMPENMTLDAFIDLYGADLKLGLQALRRDLYKRLSGVHEQGEQNRIRLHAASEVVTGVLRHIGVIEPKQTYGPREHV
ncbi:MAG: flagellar export chaperone FlgN [Mariprofundaceae bacterium]